MLDCANATSVFEAIERTWSDHQRARQAATLSLYKHLAVLLTEVGFVTDGGDGLEVLEHCRRHNLPVVDILHMFEERVRAAGYKGGALNLADCQNSQEFLVFYDSARFPTFTQMRPLAVAAMAQAEAAKDRR